MLITQSSIICKLFISTSENAGQENLEYGRRDSSLWPRGTLYSQKLALTSPNSGRSVGTVRSRIQAKKFSYFYFRKLNCNLIFEAWIHINIDFVRHRQITVF
jgi:hypothetical protein